MRYTETHLHPTFVALLADVAGKSSAPSNHSKIETMRVVGQLASHWPRQPTDEMRTALEQFARKLAITKRVHAHYLLKWNRDRLASEVSTRDYQSIAIVLLAFASLEISASTDDPGFGLHLVNGALFAQERCIDLSADQNAQLRAIIVELISRQLHA